MVYYINTVTQEVHKSSCGVRPAVNENFLGEFDDSSQAVSCAKTCGYYEANGCAECCPEVHTK